MEDAEGTLLDEGADSFPLMCGDMGKVARSTILECGCKREVEDANVAGVGGVVAVVAALK